MSKIITIAGFGGIFVWLIALFMFAAIILGFIGFIKSVKNAKAIAKLQEQQQMQNAQNVQFTPFNIDERQ